MPMDLKTSQMLLEIFKAELRELHQSLVDGLLSLEKVTSKAALEETLSELFRYSHNMKGAATSASVNAIALIAHRLEDLFTQWRTKHHFPDKAQISACLHVADNILHVLDSFCRGETIDVETYLAPLTGRRAGTRETDEIAKQEFIKLPLSRVEQASAKANEFVNYQLKLGNWFKEIGHSLQELNQLSDDNLYRSSLVKKMNTISSDGSQFFGEFSRSVQALQDELKTMRMLPISTVLLPLNRTVRDVASALNKSVELKIEGGDVELDKNILDAIRAPLQHLVRNAIDHGIESTSQRKKLNKPVPAKLTIRISQVSGKIKLEFSDDGQGMDLEKIKEYALSTGLYKEEELQGFDDSQILNCIFTSGFSMQKKITEISGRGVGLDVVKNNIQKIKGTIAVATAVGQGSCFTLTLPLTLATTRGVLFKIKEQIFMLPTISLNALYEINADSLKLVDNKYILVIDNKPIPIKILSKILKIDNSSPVLKGSYSGLLIDYHSKNSIFLADAIIDEHACVVKPLPFPYSQLDHYIGVTLTGESDLVLVLDPFILMQMAFSDESSWLEQAPSAPLVENIAVVKKRVLVVDDSLTARALCSNAVEAAGYEAVSAIDGKKAWELLQAEKFDCVITDILMPVMDGFELTKLIKTNKKYTHIPVIIVSSLDSKKDKQHGLDAGANAFIVKSEFDTHALVQMMESLL